MVSHRTLVHQKSSMALTHGGAEACRRRSVYSLNGSQWQYKAMTWKYIKLSILCDTHLVTGAYPETSNLSRLLFIPIVAWGGGGGFSGLRGGPLVTSDEPQRTSAETDEMMVRVFCRLSWLWMSLSDLFFLSRSQTLALWLQDQVDSDWLYEVQK